MTAGRTTTAWSAVPLGMGITTIGTTTIAIRLTAIMKGAMTGIDRRGRNG